MFFGVVKKAEQYFIMCVVWKVFPMFGITMA